MQFIPAVERLPEKNAKNLGLGLATSPLPMSTAQNPRLMPWSVSPERLARFYINIFNAWVVNDVGSVFVQLFDVASGNWLGAGFGLCQFSPKCGMAVALEHNGDLYSCDHYVYPDYKLGNIMQTPLTELVASKAQQRFGDDKLDSLPGYCKDCDVRQACHGDCPWNLLYALGVQSNQMIIQGNIQGICDSINTLAGPHGTLLIIWSMVAKNNEW